MAVSTEAQTHRGRHRAACETHRRSDAIAAAHSLPCVHVGRYLCKDLNQSASQCTCVAVK